MNPMSKNPEYEIEAKLIAPGRLQLCQFPAALESLGAFVSNPEQIHVMDHYLDTADLHLLAKGWAMRVRDLDSRRLLTLKSTRPEQDGISKREELEQELPRDFKQWQFPESILGGRVHELLQGANLQRLFTVEQDRTLYSVIHQDSLQLEASCDVVNWLGDAGSEQAYLAEIELKQGTEQQLRSLLLRLLESLNWKTALKSKFERGLEVAGLTQAD
jgi:inorganic triphosphatase YgiF